LQINDKNDKLVIEIKDLSFAYDKELVLKDINLEVFDKDFLVIIGPNGGGKSTLVKLMLGIYHFKKGSIKILGQPLNKKFTEVGYVPQNTNVNIDFPIKAIEVVMMGHSSSKQTFFGYKKQEIDHAKHILEQVGMLDFANSKIGSLSGGQRQRVMIARALYSNAKILFLDEPTSSIDVDGQKDIYELLKKLNKEVPIIVISHDLSMIIDYATKVAHINKKLTFHDLTLMKKKFKANNKHICEVELLEMIGQTI
jgi:zinc transport system ATP-binding protein